MVRYDLSGADVLVADRNRRMLALLRDMLTALGVGRTRCFAEAEAALASHAAAPADLVIAARHLPPLEDGALVRRLRDPARSGDPRVPILLLTGGGPAEAQAARDLSVEGVLARPVAARALYAGIVAVIEAPGPQ